MGDTIPGFIIFIAGVILAAVIVGVGFRVYNSQKETANAVIEQTSRLNNQLQESEWMQYDFQEVTGSDVLAVIQRMESTDTWVWCMGQSFVYGGGTENQTGTGGALGTAVTDEKTLIKNAKTRGGANYINPSSIFVGVVCRDDATDAIVGISFIQKNKMSGGGTP